MRDMIVHPRNLSPFNWASTLAGLLMLTAAGCGDTSTPRLQTGYGKVRQEPGSINSTSLFAERLERQGIPVTVRSRISPRLEQFETVVWFPDAVSCPSEETVARLEAWLRGGYQRTLVYVGGNYHADADYFRAVIDKTPADLREEVLRRIAEAEMEARQAPDRFFELPRVDCKWFKQVVYPPTTSRQLAGPWVEPLASDGGPTLSYRTLLEPGGSPVWEAASRLTIDGHDFAFELTDRQSYLDGRIIVISNASFLVNFGLIDHQRSRLADQLVSELASGGNVLILESGPGDVPISDSEYVNRNNWSWIAEAPLCYIVPHFLFWGVLFCFVHFPIFGRPRRLPEKSTTTFRNHINAVARQFQRSRNLVHARQQIQRYYNLIDDKSRGGKQPPD